MIPSKHLRNLLLRRLFHVPKLSITTPTESSHESIEKFEIHCKTVKQLEALGGILAEKAKVGDVYLLTGSVGAGKTCLARGFIRKMTGSKHLAVTSPTFLLDNTYEVKDKEHIVHHLDLYRLRENADYSILGIPDIFRTGICLIEWPERLQELPKSFVRVHIGICSENKTRTVSVTPVGEDKDYTDRFDRIIKRKTFHNRFSVVLKNFGQ